MERDSKNEVADSFNLIVDAVGTRKRQTRHASYRYLLQGFEFDLHFGFSGSTCFFHMIPHVVLAHLSS